MLVRCLDALLAQRYQNFEILVVDDGSTDRSRAILDGYGSEIEKLLLPQNLGIAQARAAAVARSSGEVLAFIDNDGYAAPDWLSQIVARLSSSDDVGAVASTVFLADSPALLNGAGGGMNFWCEAGDCCFGEPYEWSEIPDETLYPMGCGMAIWREVWDKVGPPDPALRRWFDDVEIGIRIWMLGMRVLTAPAAHIDHQLHASYMPTLRAESLRARLRRPFDFERARVRTGIKCLPASDLVVWIGAECLRAIRDIATGGWRAALIRIAAWFWNLCHLLSALKIRRRFRFASSNSLAQFRSLSRLPFPPHRAPYAPPILPKTSGWSPHYGWYGPVDDSRLLDPLAACFVRVEAGSPVIAIDASCSRAIAVRVRLRSLLTLAESAAEPQVSESRSTVELFSSVAPGVYELVFDSRNAGDLPVLRIHDLIVRELDAR